ncbi:MAG: hypothetical protein KGL35_13400 [Bradyrhizobium sp.]|nr:hypothetical protein [Bradyrhizobium sp.]
MSRRFAIVLAALLLSAQAAAPSTSASSDVLDADIAEETQPAGPRFTTPPAPEHVTPVHATASPSRPSHAASANPLWEIPLTQLSATRDRPIFSPSRRPEPVAAAADPVIVKPPARKKEIEPPRLLLVGTIASIDESFGIFIDQSTQAALRLKVGDDYQGWKLTTILAREVTMGKDDRSAVLALPQPGGRTGEVRLLPVSARARR